MNRPLLLILLSLILATSCGSDVFTIVATNKIVQPTCQIKESFFYMSKSNLNGEWNQAPNASYNIWKMSSDGQEKVAITKNSVIGLNSLAPSVSADGKYVAYQSLSAIDGSWDGAASLSSNIWIADVSGNIIRKLTSNTNVGLDSSAPHISPDGNWITFTSKMDITGVANGTTSNSINLWVAALDGSSMRPITKNTNSGYDCSSPKFSPDSKKIVFGCKTALNGSWNGTATPSNNIWIATIADDSILPLTVNTLGSLNSGAPQFSPDNLKIGYSSNMNLSGVTDAAGTISNVWIMNVDGSNKVALTRNTLVTSPSGNFWFSPDGSKLSFQSKMTLDGVWNAGSVAQYNLWFMKVDGTNMLPITKHVTTSPIAVHGVFSPDGKSLIYRSLENLSGIFDDTVNPSLNVWRYTIAEDAREALTKNTAVSLDSEINPNSAWVSECEY